MQTATVEKTITLTHNEVWLLIDKLYRAAGVLSDAQEFGCGDFAKDCMNASKKEIFDVIRQIDPRK